MVASIQTLFCPIIPDRNHCVDGGTQGEEHLDLNTPYKDQVAPLLAWARAPGAPGEVYTTNMLDEMQPDGFDAY
jgi:hypothetical protein